MDFCFVLLLGFGYGLWVDSFGAFVVTAFW